MGTAKASCHLVGRQQREKGKPIDGYIENGEEFVLSSGINHSCVL